MKTLLPYLLLLLPICSVAATLSTAPPPEWVHPVAVDLDKPVPADEISDGTFFRLVDRQQLDAVGRQDSEFEHYVETAVNEHGVETISQINIDYDPSYQSIIFHSLTIWRDNKALDKTHSARTNILQREEEMADNIYNGLHTLNIIISDVRIGDTLDYSYSVIGSNPLFQDAFSADFSLQWSVPVGKLAIRVLSEKAQPLRYQFSVPEQQLEITRRGKISEYRYQNTDIHALETDSQIPGWHNPYPTLYLTEFDNWGEVVSWALPLFTKATQTPDEIQRIANNIMQAHSSDTERVAQALQYVQREIRYLGLEIADNTHEPFAAGITLKRRYGDCKDKAVLLISLLKAMGIHATPALVNTQLQHSIANTPPSPRMFDHAIVYLELNHQPFWLDPTRRYQGGSLDTLFQPDYGMALLLANGSTELAPMTSQRATSTLFTEDVIDLTSADPGEVYFENHSVYLGLKAEQQRSRIASQGIAQIREDYLSFYRDYYSSISVVDETRFDDDVMANKIESHERYRISNFWEDDPEAGKQYASFYSNLVSDYLDIPDRKPRTSPFKLRHPSNITQTIQVRFGEPGWSFNDEHFEENNPWFRFLATVEFDAPSKQLNLTYEYVSKTDHVPAQDFPEYLRHLEKANEQLDYEIFRYQDHQASEPHWSDKVDWPLLAISILLFGFVLVFIWWQVETRNRPYSEPSLYFPVAPGKFIYMSIVTLNLYPLYWFYRNWKYVRETQSPTIMPFFRALFSAFWYFPLYQRLHKESATGLPPYAVGIVLALLYLLFTLLSRMDFYGWLFMVAAILVTLPLLNHINHLNQATPAAQKSRSRLGARHFLLGILTTPLILLSAGGESGLLPHESVIKGTRLWSHDLRFMQRMDIIEPGEKVLYFYSDALLSIRNDGNGFTENRVFSYWKDDENQLQVETAAYEEIADIEITWSSSWDENTIARIVRNDGSDFLLFASHINRNDKRFIDSLQKQWHQRD